MSQSYLCSLKVEGQLVAHACGLVCLKPDQLARKGRQPRRGSPPPREAGRFRARPNQDPPPVPAEGLPPCHSITSSARARNEAGTSRPSAAAVFRLTTSLKRVGRSTGRSPTLAPFRTLPIRLPVLRKSS